MNLRAVARNRRSEVCVDRTLGLEQSEELVMVDIEPRYVLAHELRLGQTPLADFSLNRLPPNVELLLIVSHR